MANRKEYDMLFKLNSELGSSFSGAFKKAQSELAAMQRQIEALNKSQSDIAAYQKQQTAIADTEKKLENLKQQYANIQQEIQETGGFSSDLENKLLSKQQQIDKTAASLDRHNEKLEQMQAELKEAGIDTENLTGESERLSREVKELTEQEDNFGNTGAMAFDAVASAISAAGIAVALREVYEYFQLCAQASMEFESAITGVAKTTDLTDEELAVMSDAIKQMSTEIPATTTEIAAVAEAAGQLGIQKDALLSFTETMTMLGTATNMTADEAATALARFANITGMSADNYDRLGSVIVDLGNNFATTESEITQMGTRLASAGKLAGLTEPEILALAAAMSSVGIEAEAGGTAMTQTLNAIEKAVAQGEDSLDEFARIAGMSSDEFAAAWETDAMSALTAFIGGLGKLDEQGESTVLVLEGLGLTGIRQSNMLKSLGLAADQMTGAVNTANTAWQENVALANEANKRYATTESQLAMMQNAYNNVKVAIGDAYNPVLKELYAIAAKLLNSLAQFIREHPALVRAITAFIGVIGLAAGALAAFAAITKVVIPLMTLLTASIPGVNIIMGVVAGVAALTAAIVGLASAADSEAKQVREMTESSREQYFQLQELREEYEAACETYGETSEEARYLAWRVDELSDSFESSRQTLSEYQDEFRSTIDSINEGLGSYREAYLEIGNNEENTLALVHRLQDLASQSEKTAETQEEMKAIIAGLNEIMPELALNYDDVVGGVTDVTAAIESMVRAQAAAQRYEAAQEGMVNALNAQYDAQKRLQDATEQQASAQERYDAAEQAYLEKLTLLTKYDTTGYGALGMIGSAEQKEYDAAKEALDTYTADIAEAQEAYDSASSEYQKYLDELTTYAETTEEAADSTQAMNKAITDTKEQMDELAAAYQAAYDTALESVQGQYQLWDEAAEVVATSAGTINSNLQGQITYWQDYNANLASLRERTGDVEGLSDVIASFADGSADSVNAVAGMAAANDEDLAAMVQNWKDLQTEQDKVADNIAELKTSFSEQMDALGEDLAADIAAMNLSTEATDAGEKTLQGYIAAANSMLPQVQAAYQRVANAAVSALHGSYTPRRGYASGTRSAERGFAMVGENGPELVYFNGGEQVMTAEETAAMQSGLSAEAQMVTFSPMLMRALSERDEAVYADMGGSGGASAAPVSITFQIDGNVPENVVEQLRAYGDEFAERVREVMEDVNAEHERRVYR